MPLQFTCQEISRKYDRFARWYDWIEGLPDLLGVSKLRQRLLRVGSGCFLEIAVGTGKNLKFYPRGSRIIALDLSPEMLNVARQRAAKLPVNISFVLADAEALPFSEKSFDTAISSLSGCTFPNPVCAYREMARVCKPNGRILLLEHGRSNRGWLARWQDRHADQFAEPLGCHWNREPQELAREAGVKIAATQRFFFGIFHLIEGAL